jgi:quercetin dioxygenase-like cupin family protein
MQALQTTWTAQPAEWRGEFQGSVLHSQVSIIFTTHNRPGSGPQLHQHPYSETFIVRKGVVEFSDGRETFEAHAGQIVVVPSDTPHRFTAKSDVLEMIDIHASPDFIATWLDS